MTDETDNVIVRRLEELGFTRMDRKGSGFAHAVTVLETTSLSNPEQGSVGTGETLRIALGVSYPWYLRLRDCTVVVTEHDGMWQFRGNHSPLGTRFHSAAIGGEDA